MATRKPMKKFKRYDEGGPVMGEMDPREAAAKKRGLDISNKEAPVGFFERIKAGNIDQPGSEAYNRFGAGRGYAQNMDDENEAMRAANRAPSAPVARPPAQPNPIFAAGLEQGKRQPSGDASVAEDYAGPRTKPIVTAPVKPSAPKPTAPNKQSTGFYMPPATRDKPNFSNEGRTKPAPAGSSMASQIPGQSAQAPQGQKIDSSETSRNIENAMLATGAGGVGLAGLYKMFKGGKKAAGKVAPYLKELTMDKKKLTGPSGTSKSSSMGKADDEKAAKAYKRLKNSSFIKKSGDDVTDVTAKKHGGSVKKYASGGMVSSASRRADGIATKGKTNCKMR